MASGGKSNVIRSGEVTVEKGGKVYTARYDVLPSSVVRLQTGQAIQLGGLTEDAAARVLLREAINSGLADREGLGRPRRSRLRRAGLARAC